MERLVDAGEEDFDDIILSALNAALLSWVDEAFRITFKAHSLDSQLATQVQTLLPVAAAIAISDKQFLELGTHPLQQLIDHLYTEAVGWHRGLGRTGKPLSDAIDKLIGGAQEYFEFQERSFEELLADLKTFLQEESNTIERLQGRVIESELGRLKAESARVTAGRALNDFMRGKEFPILIMEFLGEQE